MSSGLELEIGRRLRQLREARGYTVNIADQIRARFAVKLDRSHLSRMERGKAAIPLRTLFALINFYEADIQDVLPHNSEPGTRPIDPLLEHIRNAPGLGSRLTELYAQLGPDKLEEVLFTITDAILSCLPDRSVRRKTLEVAQPEHRPTPLAKKKAGRGSSAKKSPQKHKTSKKTDKYGPETKPN